MTRDEHLAWAKARALEYIAQGRGANAIASLAADLAGHEETAGHPAIETMRLLADGPELSDPAKLCRFIEGLH